ncbi:type I restriction endonuclease subunit R [Roseofilum sp. BLCC_M91]|uniref:Type I restriction endonuclease subunit R n=1 Tax=Roseofilum halophilum BLCC-M91 TaxID=3022259 RepID=A0ABT7BEE3_9CYAN|nr:restriction endonuclease subunit R [Roseofilum halophilum]MDJ1177541.1 type I restriction endonuclease subunit R [Roseofilum halophilum BLCC-M91]
MTQTIPPQDITLEELQEHLGLQLTTDPNFFPEWQQNLPELSDREKQTLQRVCSNYFNLVSRRPLLEEAVKMVILSPLLDLAGFFQPPFSIRTETPIDLSVEDRDLIIRGRIDVLVIKQSLWILIVEAKSTKIDIMEAVPQALSYMLKNGKQNQPIFGFLLNGREFVFVKLQSSNPPIYSRSYALSIERPHELEQVLSVLKTIGQLA